LTVIPAAAFLTMLLTHFFFLSLQPLCLYTAPCDNLMLPTERNF